MKAITIKPPWAQAIIQLGKDVENRTRNIAGTYRGLLAIHVSTTGVDSSGYEEIARITHQPIPAFTLHQGYIIGVVDLVDVHTYPWCLREYGRCCSWWAEPVDGTRHLVLENPRSLKYPMWAVGHLGLWEIDDAKLAGRWEAPDV